MQSQLGTATNRLSLPLYSIHYIQGINLESLLDGAIIYILTCLVQICIVQTVNSFKPHSM